jgi:hypothetical protein
MIRNNFNSSRPFSCARTHERRSDKSHFETITLGHPRPREHALVQLLTLNIQWRLIDEGILKTAFDTYKYIVTSV